MKSPVATPEKRVKETEICPGGDLEIHRQHAQAGAKAASRKSPGRRGHQ